MFNCLRYLQWLLVAGLLCFITVIRSDRSTRSVFIEPNLLQILYWLSRCFIMAAHERAWQATIFCLDSFFSFFLFERRPRRSSNGTQLDISTHTEVGQTWKCTSKIWSLYPSKMWGLKLLNSGGVMTTWARISWKRNPLQINGIYRSVSKTKKCPLYILKI